MLRDSRETRQRMVDGQLTPNGITNEALLAAMKLVPREFFAPMDFAGSAYVDEEIPLGHGRMLMEPMVLAQLIQSLDLSGIERVLIIGGALGYSAAVMAHLVAEVAMVEDQPELLAHARSSLPLLGLRNVELIEGPLADPQVKGGFDAILIEGAVEEIPQPVIKKLKDHGKIAYVAHRARRIGGVQGVTIGLGQLKVATREGSILKDKAFAEAGVTLLPAFAAKPSFAFA